MVCVGLLAAGCVALGSPALRQTPNTPSVWDNSDPDVLVDAGKTYLFGSTNNMRVPVRQITDYGATLSTSKSAWGRGPRDAMPTRPGWVDAGEPQIWAPSVVKIGTVYHLYFAAAHKAATTDENNDQCIGRAVSSSPLGPYTPHANPLYCGFPPEGAVGGMPASNSFGRGALDPEVIRAPGGRLYMLMALSRTKQNIGVVPLDSAGAVIGGRNATPTILQSQSLPWHDGTDDSTLVNGFLENPSMVYEPSTKTYLLVYSAGRWDSANYVTGFSRCETPTGPCTHDTRGPFLKSGTSRTGPGGMTAYRSAAGELRVAYASWERGHEAPADNEGGRYSRQTHWALLKVSGHTDPAKQSISLG